MSKGQCVYSSASVILLDLWWLQHSPPDLPEKLSALLWGYGGRDHSSTVSHSFSFHPPETVREAGALCSSIPSHLMLCVASSPPPTRFTVSWATVWLFLNYCIWNQLPNRAAKNTPSNQIIVMWVDKLFLYTVLVANKTLNSFRKLERER